MSDRVAGARRLGDVSGRLVGYLLLSAWALLAILPFVVMLLGSVKTTAAIYSDPFGLPAALSTGPFTR